MTRVIKGWGVFLATVEVTDVKICSGTLFKNLQTQFREANQKKATIERLEVESSIKEEEMTHQLESNKRDWDTKLVQANALNAQALQRARQEVENFKQKIEIDKKATLRNHAKIIQQKENWVQQTLRELEFGLESKRNTIDKEIKEEIA